MNRDFRDAQLQRLLDGADPAEVLKDVRERSFSLNTQRNGSALLRYRNCVSAIRKQAMEGATLDATVRDELKRVAQSHLNRVLSGGGGGGDSGARIKKKLKSFMRASLKDKIAIQHRVTKRKEAFTGDADLDAAIAGVELHPPFFKGFTLSREDLSALKERTHAAVEKRAGNVIPLSTRDVTSYLNYCRALLVKARSVENDAAREDALIVAKRRKLDLRFVLCALAFVTGRRAGELLYSGQFKPPSSRGSTSNPYITCFSGQIKTGFGASRCFDIPLLAPREDVIAALKLVRRRWGKATSVADVNKKYAMVMKRAVEASKFASLDPQFRGGGGKSRLHFHSLREAYGMCTYHAYQPHAFSPHYWLSRVLGHSGLNQSAHYANVQVPADFGATAQRLVQLLDAGVSPAVAPKHAADPAATTRALDAVGATTQESSDSLPILNWDDARQQGGGGNGEHKSDVDSNSSTASEDLDELAASL